MCSVSPGLYSVIQGEGSKEYGIALATYLR